MARRFPMLFLAALLFVPGLAHAAGPTIPLETSGVNVRDQASLQRGARLYMNYCLGCHSLQYVRYNTLAEGLGLTEQQVADNLQFTGERIHDQIRIAMPAEDAAGWFGLAPPDLSLIARARGTDWVYTFLKSFYADPSQRITGTNNKVLEGTAMPHVLWELQSSLAAAEYSEAVRDITAFLSWAAEPMQLKRQRLGIWVLLFLSVLFVFSYLYYKELWKDVK